MVVRCGSRDDIIEENINNARIIVARTCPPPHHHQQDNQAMVKPLPPLPRIRHIGIQTEQEFIGHNINIASRSFSSLWSKRFTRWWGWTWLRKRARTFNKTAREAR